MIEARRRTPTSFQLGLYKYQLAIFHELGCVNYRMKKESEKQRKKFLSFLVRIISHYFSTMTMMIPGHPKMGKWDTEVKTVVVHQLLRLSRWTSPHPKEQNPNASLLATNCSNLRQVRSPFPAFTA